MLTSLKQAKVTFTGKLACLSRQEAYQIVKDSGAEPAHGISRRTSVVVVGMRGWPLLPDGMISNKLKRAEELIKRGYKIEIISESFFLELAGRKERQASLRKTYAGEEVCKLLKISPETLQRWEQFSLVHSQNGLYDFQDLVSLRTIGELVNRGVRPGTIAKSLSALSSVLPDTDRPLSQLKIVIDHPKAILVDMGECLMAPNGQLMINFDAQPKSEGAVVSLGPENLSADSWFEYGQTCEEDELYSEAEEAYRKAISIWPHFPEAYFNLGNVLRIVGKPLAAEELYRMAATQEPGMESAWYNLADIQEERGQIKEAIASLKCALQACPNYADAHFNLALCFEKIGQEREAGRHWVAYLKLDPSSQWAEIAKRRLSRH
jgi:tetratricopeptide (TPR) repeat protein